MFNAFAKEGYDWMETDEGGRATKVKIGPFSLSILIAVHFHFDLSVYVKHVGRPSMFKIQYLKHSYILKLNLYLKTPTHVQKSGC